ncbi:MAG: hypothetical protein IJP71_06670 [Lachnospiraceae bacterium]|nr:hypothetical protein [Lachnospiraceae bacterium]
MGKVLEHQNEFEVKLRELISNNDGISYVSSAKSKYIAIKYYDRVLLTIYFRASEIRIYINKNNNNLDFYSKLLSEGKVYQHDTADENNAKDKFAFYVNEKHEEEVINRFIERADV